ncbi:MAG: YggT family protein [Nitrospinota bacterium]|nr:YggT family protein [Nitrospinota bacterium]
MFILGNFFVALGYVIQAALTVYMWIIIARVVISWVNADPYNQIVMIIRGATDPVLNPVSRRLPPMGGLDFSPIVVLLAIMFLQVFMGNSLIQIGYSLGAK